MNTKKRVVSCLVLFVGVGLALATADVADSSPRATLSREAPNVIAWAVTGLDQNVPPDIRRSMTYLREDLLDAARSSAPEGGASYKIGCALCNALIDALDEHDRGSVRAGYRAAQAEAITRVTSQALESRRNYKMSWPQYAREVDQRNEIQRQQNNKTALVKESVRVDWANHTATLRQNLDGLYSAFREALRQDPTFQKGDAPLVDTTSQRPIPDAVTAAPHVSPTAVVAPVVAREPPPEVRDLLTREFAALPLEERINRVKTRMKELNPGFDGEFQVTFNKSMVKNVKLRNTGVRNLWPLCALPIDRMDCLSTPVEDLSPLVGKRLQLLNLSRTEVKDLSPLVGMPLKWLWINRTRVSDLTPLAGMQLTLLSFDSTAVVDLSPLATMPRLQKVDCAFVPSKDSAILRSITTLTTINGLPVKEFWSQVDAGKSPQAVDKKDQK